MSANLCAIHLLSTASTGGCHDEENQQPHATLLLRLRSNARKSFPSETRVKSSCVAMWNSRKSLDGTIFAFAAQCVNFKQCCMKSSATTVSSGMTTFRE